MGASFWYSFTPYHRDPRHALREVQQKVLAEARDTEELGVSGD